MLRVCEQNLDDLAPVEDVATQRRVRRERAEAVVGDQTQAAALAQALDPAGEEHRVCVVITGGDTPDALVCLSLPVELGIDALLVL